MLNCFRCTAKWFSYTYIYTYIYIFFFRFFSIICYYKILTVVPCATLCCYLMNETSPDFWDFEELKAYRYAFIWEFWIKIISIFREGNWRGKKWILKSLTGVMICQTLSPSSFNPLQKKKKKIPWHMCVRLTNGKTEACTGQVAARWHSRSLWPKAQAGSTTWPAALLGQGRRQSQRLLCDPLTFIDGLFLPFNSILHPQWARFCGLSIENEWTSSKTTMEKGMAVDHDILL